MATQVADKGKYAVDTAGEEEEEGIPQWAIFAGIGGLLLVIIIIIIVVVAGSSDDKATTATTTTTTAQQKALVATAQALLDTKVGEEITVAGVSATVIDVSAILTAANANYDAKKDPGGIVPVQTSMVVTMSLPKDITDADRTKLETAVADKNKKELAKALGIDAEWIEVIAKFAAARRALSEGAPTRVLESSDSSLAISQTVLMPAATVQYAAQVAKVSALKGIAQAAVTVPGVEAKSIGGLVQTKSAAITTTGSTDADFANAVKAAEALLAVQKKGAAEKVTALLTLVKEGKTGAELVTAYKAEAVKVVAKFAQEMLTKMVAALPEEARTTIKVGTVAANVVTAENLKERDDAPIVPGNLNPPKKATPAPKETPSNSTNGSSTGLRSRVRRGLSEEASTYYSKLVDRIMV